MTLKRSICIKDKQLRSLSEDIFSSVGTQSFENPVKSNTVEVLQKDGEHGHDVLIDLDLLQRDKINSNHDLPADNGKRIGLIFRSNNNYKIISRY